MRTVGIICEYNPFHTGHAHQLAAARQTTGADVTVAVMSEHITQRGELAIADGYVRAEAAVRAGVDLVIGLPFPYSSAPAEFFALAGVRILDALGVDALHFGSECGDMDALQDCTERLYAREFIDELTKYQQSHPSLGVMQCRDELYRERHGHSLPSGSNDLLGMAYLHALTRESSPMRPYTVKREGQAYVDAATPLQGVHPSATAIRALWRDESLETLRPHLPDAVWSTLSRAVDQHLAPVDERALSSALVTFYRTSDAKALSECYGLEGGLADRLCCAAREVTDLASLLRLAATRRYTDARIRRSVWYGFCGVTERDVTAPPAYVRLLGANARGCAYLSDIRKRCTLHVLTKPADLPSTPEASRQTAIEQRLEHLITLAYPTPQPSGSLVRRRPYIDKS